MSRQAYNSVSEVRSSPKRFPMVSSLVSFKEWGSWKELAAEEHEREKTGRPPLIEPMDGELAYFYGGAPPTKKELRLLSKRVKNNNYLYINSSSSKSISASTRRQQLDEEYHLKKIDYILQAREQGNTLDWFQIRDVNIVAELYSPKALNFRKAWCMEWETNYSKYEKSMYFLTNCTGRWNSAISRFFRSRAGHFNKDFAPPFTEYCDALVRVVKRAEGYLSKPKYKIGDIAELRPVYGSNYELRIFDIEGRMLARSDYYRWRKIANFQERGFVTIIGVDSLPPQGDRKGNKLYTVFSMDDTRPFLIEQSLIKKIRGVKRRGKK